MQRIAVVRMLPGLGDLLCAVPALHGLRAGVPDAAVTLIGRRSSRWFAERYAHLVDDWIGCDWLPGLVESDDDQAALADVIHDARSRRFDVAVQMHGDGRVTNAFTASLGARRWGGLAPAGVDSGCTLTAADCAHEIDRCVLALRAAGIDARRGPLDFPLTAEDRRPSQIADGSVAVIHAGASRPDRRWPATAFAAVAEHLLTHVDHVALTGGRGECDVARAVLAALERPVARRVVDVTGRTSVGSLAALLSESTVVVSNDTGAAHLAAAVDAPTVTVFATSDHHRWRPRGADRVSVGGADRWPSVTEVASAVDALLDRSVAC